MKLVVGLGNPGDKYLLNRHNVGAIILDEYFEKKSLEWERSAKMKGVFCKSGEVIFFKPENYMNESGESVSLAANYFKIAPADILVIHDDLDLPFGTVKKRFASGSAGHHGVESVISNLGTKDFWRLRVGIGRPTEFLPVEDYVLSNFTSEELEKIKSLDFENLLDPKA